MSNPYFKNTYDPRNNEAELFRRASDEICEREGVDFYYMPRTMVNLDNIFGEDTISQFNSNKTITFKIENYSNFDGMGDIFGKFGFTPDNQLTLIVEKERFRSITELNEPYEGDIIYQLNGKKAFEITFVESEDGMFQFNFDEYVFRIKAKAFEYSYEDLNTGIDALDDIEDEDSSTSAEADEIEAELASTLNLDEADIFGNL